MTFKGDKPLNTHGGQLSYGQASTAGGCAQVTEAVRQIRRDAGEHQVPGPTDLIYVTGSGGTFSQQSALLLASDAAGGFITGAEIVVDGGYHAMTI